MAWLMPQNLPPLSLRIPEEHGTEMLSEACFNPKVGYELGGKLGAWAEQQLIGEAFINRHLEWHGESQHTWWIITFDSERDLLTFKMYWC